jgi:hypothetical protein
LKRDAPEFAARLAALFAPIKFLAGLIKTAPGGVG